MILKPVGGTPFGSASLRRLFGGIGWKSCSNTSRKPRSCRYNRASKTVNICWSTSSLNRLVRGMISFIAYQSPLKGQDLDEGIAYFLPPLFPMPFSGEHAESVAKSLDQGGISSKVTDDISADSAMASTVLIPAVGGLELADWDLKAFRTGELLDLTSAATKEAQSITAAHHDTKVPLTNRTIARPWLLRCGLAAASPMLPFDLEDYLAFHFEKTSDQTRQMLRKWIELGERHGCKTDALRILVERLG